MRSSPPSRIREETTVPITCRGIAAGHVITKQHWLGAPTSSNISAANFPTVIRYPMPVPIICRGLAVALVPAKQD